MCGIAGWRWERPVAPDVLKRMLDAQIHRGPDSMGQYESAPFHAGMRRLSINDVAHGDQPLYNQNRDVALLYNGEIYNSPALQKRLEAKGYRFQTHSDGEVICHLYDEMGLDLFSELDGMFAAALWIKREKRLVLARDIPGEKPLHYALLPDNGIVFASEIGALKQFPGLDLSLDRQALWDFPTFLWIPEPDTVYKQIKALPRGHLLIADQDGIRTKPFAFAGKPSAALRNDADAVAATRSVVTEAVTSRLLSDVPVGSFLSSGLDSSIVATIAARQRGQLTTFSIGFEDTTDPYHGTSDESAAAAEYAARIGTDHHAIRITPQDFRDSLPTFCRHGDQPFAVSSGLGILAVSKAARDLGIKVLLSGDGADELFGGYSWYEHVIGAHAAPSPQALNHRVVSFQNFGLPLAERLTEIAAMPGPKRAWAWHYYAAEEEKAALFSRDFSAGLDTSLRHFAHHKPDNWQDMDFVEHDRAFYLPFEMMRKLDRMTMAMSVEGRAPFVAPPVLEHAKTLSQQQLVKGKTLKWALREAFSDILPEDVRARPKHGFNVPIDLWLKDDWRDLVDHAFSRDSALQRHGMIDSASHKAALTLLNDPERLNGHSIFCYVMLNMWLEQES